MVAIVNSNLSALSSQRLLAQNANGLGAAMQRLSSGLRINSAKDDAAGLAISERFTTQIKGTDQAARNANDAISLAQTAEGALASISSNLQRIRELAVQSANSTNNASDRAALQAEATQLIAENDRIVNQTQFNGTKLLDGSFSGQAFQVGANAGQTVTMPALDDMRSNSGPMGQQVGQYDNWFTVRFPASDAGGSTIIIQNSAGFSIVSMPHIGVDAKAAADSMNTVGIPGFKVTADVNTVAAAATQTSNGSASGVATLTLNNVAINLSYTTGASAAAQNRAAAVSAINAQSANTGVVASDTGTGVSLTAADGRNIVTAYSAGGATGSTISDFGLGPAGTAISTPRFRYHPPPNGNIISIDAQSNGFTSVTLNAIDVATGKNYYCGTSVGSIDLSTASGANTALQSLDNALATVSAARANMGAVQSRFQSAITNLQSGSENMNASRSRITDADFAQETANLSRAQILQQAGTAMVAQANQSPQGVLALLR